MKVARNVKGDNGSKSGTDILGRESGVLFPRLNVKETKTDGPRAPPRNKMALYEQFTVPSQRFAPPTPSAANKMALYEQFTVPSHNFFQPPNHGAARQNPAAFNQRDSCDGRFVYTPYYVSSPAYAPVGFPGRFLGQNLMSFSNSAATESDMNTKCDLAKSTEQSSRVVTYSSARAPKVQCNQNSLSSDMNNGESLNLNVCQKLSNSNATDGAIIGSLHLQKGEPKTSTPIVGCVSEDLRTVPPQVESLMKCPVHEKSSHVMQNDGTEPIEKEPALCKDSSQSPSGDAYCAEQGLCLLKRPIEGDKSRVELKDNYQRKSSSMLDNIADSKVVNPRGQAFVEQSHRTKEPWKSRPDFVESQFSGKNLSRDLDQDIDAYQKHGQSYEKESIREQYNSQLYNDQQSTVVASVHQDNEKGDSSDHNSDSSMVDSLHVFEITPKSVIAAIGQKEFWRARKAILRQQKIFSTQVFELHRLLKVQKLIAMSSNLLVEDNMYESLPIYTSEEQCVPTIDPEKCLKSPSVLVDHDCEIETEKGQLGNKETATHSNISSHLLVRGGSEPITNDARDRLHAAAFPVGTFVPGSASAWGYPAYVQNPCAVPPHRGCYGCYQQYPLNQLGVPNSVMGIPCSLEGNSMGSQNVHGCHHQCHCSAEHQAKALRHFSNYPSRDGLCYNSTTASTPFEPFTSAGKACYPFSDGGRSVENGSGEECSAGSFRSESVLNQVKQLTNPSIDKSSNPNHSQDSVSQVSVGQDNEPLDQTGNHGPHSKNKNFVCHLSASLSKQKQNDTNMRENNFNYLNWPLTEDAREYRRPHSKALNEDVPDAADLENQALSLFPMSSSFSCSSETVIDNSLFSSKEQQVQVIKSVPRAAMAASESTADILLSLQRERQQ